VILSTCMQQAYLYTRVSIQSSLPDTPNAKPQTSFSRAPPPREVYRLRVGQLLCQILLTRAQGNYLGGLDKNCHSKNVLCENGNTKKSESVRARFAFTCNSVRLLALRLALDREMDDFLSNNVRWLVAVPSAAYLWWFRDVAFALFLCAAIANAVVVKVLKKLLRQPRPPHSPHHGDSGMPSSHAASLFFFSSGGEFAEGSQLLLLHMTVAALALHRVRSGHHFVSQVVAGAALGGANGTLWRVSKDRCLRTLLALSGGAGRHGAIVQVSLLVIVIAGAAAVASVERRRQCKTRLVSLPDPHLEG